MIDNADRVSFQSLSDKWRSACCFALKEVFSILQTKNTSTDSGAQPYASSQYSSEVADHIGPPVDKVVNGQAEDTSTRRAYTIGARLNGAAEDRRTREFHNTLLQASPWNLPRSLTPVVRRSPRAMSRRFPISDLHIASSECQHRQR